MYGDRHISRSRSQVLRIGLRDCFDAAAHSQRRSAEVDIAGLVFKDFPGDVLCEAAEQTVVVGQLITVVLDDFRLEEYIDLRDAEMIRNDHDAVNLHGAVPETKVSAVSEPVICTLYFKPLES